MLCGLSAVNQKFSNKYKYGDLNASNTNSSVPGHHHRRNVLKSENIICRVVVQMKNRERKEWSLVIYEKSYTRYHILEKKRRKIDQKNIFFHFLGIEGFILYII
jgi:hypothetical protein